MVSARTPAAPAGSDGAAAVNARRRAGAYDDTQSERPPGTVATIAATEFPDGGGPAKIDKVTLADPHDLQMVAARVVPVTGTDLIGVFRGFPPLGTKGSGPGTLAPGIQWARRQHADGAVVRHTTGHDVINLVLVVKATGVKGTAKTVYVDYQSGGTRYRLDLRFFIQLFTGNSDGCRPASR